MPRFKVSDGIELYYDVVGNGEADTLILLHPKPFDRRVWLYQMAHLSTYFRVAVLDFPGYGKSDPMKRKDFSVGDLSEMVWTLYKELGVDTAILGGLSVGSRVAKQFALDHQQHVKALILSGCGSGTVS
jgi:pimeloyl-ACP methyl ester carboxylesterase